jgi:hypothetical protein
MNECQQSFFNNATPTYDEDLDQWLSQMEFSQASAATSGTAATTDEEAIETSSVLSAGTSLSNFSINTASRKNNKLSRFIVTFFPPDIDDKWLQPETYFPNAQQIFKCWCGQFELCPTTKRLHAHLYIECKRDRRPRFNNVDKAFRNHFGGVQIKTSQTQSENQRQCAINYVSDPDKRHPLARFFAWNFNEFETKFDEASATKKISKVDVQEQQRQYIESKPRHWQWEKIVHENEQSKKLLATCSWGEKYHKGRHAEDKTRTIRDVIILYGAGGTGKTTMAQVWDTQDNEDTQQRYYRRNPDDSKFWGGGQTAYKGQRIIHYEEFTGQEAFSRLKEVCDIGKSGPPVNIKNGGTILNHEIVIFTSNVHPAGWFRNLWEDDPKQFHPFWRRVTQLWFYPETRADGSMNIPNAENPPYYIDQTDEWRNMLGSYPAAVHHASVHWPLKQASAPTAFAPGFTMSRNQREQHVTAESSNTFFQYCKTGRY